MISKIKPRLNPLIALLAWPLRHWNPNTLTILGIIPPVIFLVAMLNNQFVIALIALIGSGFDLVDGAVARLGGKVSTFGAFLDSTFDRIADMLFITAFGFAGLVDWALVILLLAGSYLTSYIRSRAELAGSGKFSLAVGIMERTERLVGIGITLGLIIAEFRFMPGYIYASTAWSLGNWAFLILGILSIITVLQRFWATYKLLR